MIKWNLIVESSLDEFNKKFYGYIEAAELYYIKDGYTTKKAAALRAKMDEFVEYVKSNISPDYKKDDPRWEDRVHKVIDELDDHICDNDDDLDDWEERKRIQLWYDFLAYKHLRKSVTESQSKDEATPDMKKLLRQNGVSKLPAGTKFLPGRVEWSKHKGYAGQKTIRNMCIQLEHAGWKRGDWTTGGTPDGSSVANSDNYTSPDGKILMSYTEYYGSTSYDNSFYITFKLAESPANESDDWNDGGVDDNINPKFADLRDAFDKIDDGGFQWSSGKWRIRPDELGYDWKIYYDGEGWIGTVNYKTREYDVWNTKVVKKHEIKDFLHACAADSFKPMDTVSESTIKGAGRVVFEDDLVAVYTPDGKIEYKGLFDYCPYKDEPMQYDRKNMVYRFEGENGDYRTMVKVAESKVNEASRFGFEVGDKVELTRDKMNSINGEFVGAGTQGEVVAIDAPMRGVIKVKLDDGKTTSVPERHLKKVEDEDEDEEEESSDKPEDFKWGDRVQLTKPYTRKWNKEFFAKGTKGMVSQQYDLDPDNPKTIGVLVDNRFVNISVPPDYLKKIADEPKKSKRDVKPEKPEDYYMRPTTYGSPRYTGD